MEIYRKVADGKLVGAVDLCAHQSRNGREVGKVARSTGNRCDKGLGAVVVMWWWDGDGREWKVLEKW